jgi:ABC-type transporter Mla subunit MlaD
MTESNEHQPDRLDRVEAILDRVAGQLEQAAEERQQLRENLATLNEITIDFMGLTREAIARLDQTIAELRAANQRQERINDFLLRERGLN